MLEVNKIYHVDCNKFMQNQEDNVLDLIVTSPPYYNARDYSTWESYDEYLNFLTETFKNAYRVLKEGRMCVVNISTIIIPRESRSSESKRMALPFHLVNIMEEIGFKFLEDIIWVKPEGSAKNRNGRFYQDRQPIQYKPNIVNEYIFVFQKPSNYLIDKIVRSYKGEVKEKSLVLGDYDRSNVWNMNPETKVKGHSAPYPIELPYKIVKYYSYIGDLVYDPFFGSGTTGLACKQLGRNYIGTEIHDNYIKLAERRLKDMGDKYEN